MNRLNIEKRAEIITALAEGNSLRATARMTGTALNTVSRLLVAAGNAWDDRQDEMLRNLSSERIECDEVWTFCYAKERRALKLAEKAPEGAGDVYTWTAIDADSKLMVTWLTGKRDSAHAQSFMRDLKSRLPRRIQLTTDGFGAYPVAVAVHFKQSVDYAQLIKTYEQDARAEARYSPPHVLSTTKKVILGNPDESKISTSYVERMNLNMRMGMRRMTRLTNGFSKKLDNLKAATALYFAWYNFARVHQSLHGRTPAMAAGITDHKWSAIEVAAILDDPKYAQVFSDAKVGAKVA